MLRGLTWLYRWFKTNLIYISLYVFYKVSKTLDGVAYGSDYLRLNTVGDMEPELPTHAAW